MKLKLAILLIIISTVYGESFQYKRILSCIQTTPKHCAKWNQSTVLIYRTYWTYCFSQKTLVQTPTGAKSMRDLQIGDQIFAYDKDKGPSYSKIVAWLHHSPNVTAQFDIIKTNKNTSFQASDYHNVGFINHKHYDFKFAKDLEEGDQLITFPQSDTPTLVQNQIHQERHGLYSPLTEAANFYIFNNEYDGQSKDSSQMILVHSLSQVSQPVSQQWKLEAGLMTGRIQTTQPQQDQMYINPFLTNWRIVFGKHWHNMLQEVKYEMPAHQAFMPEHNRYSNSGYCNQYDPFNSNYMTSSSSCERQRQDKMQAMGLSVSIVEEMPLLL